MSDSEPQSSSTTASAPSLDVLVLLVVFVALVVGFALIPASAATGDIVVHNSINASIVGLFLGAIALGLWVLSRHISSRCSSWLTRYDGLSEEDKKYVQKRAPSDKVRVVHAAADASSQDQPAMRPNGFYTSSDLAF